MIVIASVLKPRMSSAREATKKLFASVYWEAVLRVVCKRESYKRKVWSGVKNVNNNSSKTPFQKICEQSSRFRRAMLWDSDAWVPTLRNVYKYVVSNTPTLNLISKGGSSIANPPVPLARSEASEHRFILEWVGIPKRFASIHHDVVELIHWSTIA